MSFVNKKDSSPNLSSGWVLPPETANVSRHPVPFSWAGKLFVFTARKPLDPQHFVFTTRTFLLPCPSPGIQPYPQRFIFSKNSIYGGQISGVYCGFSLYIDCKTILVLGGRNLRVQGICKVYTIYYLLWVYNG